MRRLLALSLLLAGFFPSLALAAPCPASGCGGTNYCARDSRIPEGSSCYVRCDADAPETGCAGSFRCISFSGEEICVPNDSPLISSGEMNPRCDEGRTCPTDRSYVCSSGQCLVETGGRCERNSQCFEGSECTATAVGGTTCNPTSRSVTVSPDGTTKFESITPALGVEIPGGELSDATKSEGEVIVPFLAQYINAVYRYGVTVVLVVAVVMVVYGGFRYLVGSSLGDIQAGKKIIQDALIGMLIVLGAYMLLNTVNPSTVNLSVLKLVFVDEMQLLLTTTEPTADWEGAGDSTGGTTKTGPSGLRFDPGAENPYPSCPVSLSAEIATSPYSRRDARVTEFMTEMAPNLRSLSVRDRVLAASGAAASCGIHMGSCGYSTITINEMAGVGGAGNRVESIGSDNVNYLIGINQNCARNHPRDRTCKSEARASAFERFSTQIPGWPNEWAGQLRPGDHLWIYTAHRGGAGQHATIFLGWAGRGRARVFNGQWEGNVRESVFCITTDCTNLYPITQIWSPD